jgi:hypothetical protein
MRPCRTLFALCLVFSALPAAADDLSRFNILEENDSLWFKSDQHYTQGLRFAELGPDLQSNSDWNAPFFLFDLFGSASQQSRRYSVEIGQSIFTPTNRYLVPPDPRDRPYAGWLYAGVNLLQEDDGHSLEHLEIQMGVVGPYAQGEIAQNDVHFLIHAAPFYGWHDQIANEPAGDIAYDRQWRVNLLGDNNIGVDWVPELGATGGNVFDYAEIGSLIRIGVNLGMDYGPTRIRPGLSGNDYVDANHSTGDWGFYFFVGAQGRAVARNIFLDGNDNSKTTPHVTKVPLVGDMEAGFSLYNSRGFRVDAMSMRRTIEYTTQQHPDVLCTVALSWAW